MVIGLFAGSLAVVGDGIDSATDVVISIVMIFTARLINLSLIHIFNKPGLMFN